MEIVLKFEPKDLQIVKDILLKDDITSRASMTFKDGGFVKLEGYFCYVSGTEQQCNRAIETSKQFAKQAPEKEGVEVIRKIKEEEAMATEGLGGIFG